MEVKNLLDKVLQLSRADFSVVNGYHTDSAKGYTYEDGKFIRTDGVIFYVSDNKILNVAGAKELNDYELDRIYDLLAIFKFKYENNALIADDCPTIHLEDNQSILNIRDTLGLRTDFITDLIRLALVLLSGRATQFSESYIGFKNYHRTCVVSTDFTKVAIAKSYNCIPTNLNELESKVFEYNLKHTLELV